MPIYRINDTSIEKLPETSFGEAKLKERQDLQRLLREQVEIIAPDTLVIAEEFSEWEDSKRRIDLLGLDKEANVVVIELKRADENSHMELQAIRYAAMVSAMTFERAVEVYGQYLRAHNFEADPQAAILDFLGWEEPDEDSFAQKVRILLAAADFSKELTTAVMWLNDQGLDIRCVRLKPYSDNGDVLVDVQQVIPLPEASDYQVKLREKKQKEQQDRDGAKTLFRRFWQELLDRANEKTRHYGNISARNDQYIGVGAGISGVGLNHAIWKHDASVEMYIDTGDKDRNKQIFDYLHEHREPIERDLGDKLQWQRLNDKDAARIRHVVGKGGYRDDPTNWPLIQDAMIDGMIRFERALRPYLDRIREGQAAVTP